MFMILCCFAIPSTIFSLFRRQIISFKVTSKTAICPISGYDRIWVSYLQQEKADEQREESGPRGPDGLIEAGKNFCLIGRFQGRRGT